MTVTTEHAVGILAWTGAETSFAPGFMARDRSHVRAIHIGLDGAYTDLVLDTHFGVTLAPGTNVVTATPIALPNAPGYVMFKRHTPATHQNQFQDNVRYSQALHERIADDGALRDAEIRADAKEALDRIRLAEARINGIQTSLPPWPPDSGMGPLTLGAWDGATFYPAGSRVTWVGRIWYALVDNFNKQPDISTQWELAAPLFMGGILDTPLQFPAPTLFAPSGYLPPGSAPTAPGAYAFWPGADGIWRYRFGGVNTPIMNAFLPGSWIAGSPVNRSSNSNAAFTNTAAIIPFDDTVPLIGEGTQLVSVNHACYAATHSVSVTGTVMVGVTAATWLTLALFRDNVCIGASACQLDAQDVDTITVRSAGDPVIGDTAAHSYSMRIGSNAGATLYINGGNGGRLFGGLSATRIQVEERRQ